MKCICTTLDAKIAALVVVYQFTATSGSNPRVRANFSKNAILASTREKGKSNVAFRDAVLQNKLYQEKLK